MNLQTHVFFSAMITAALTGNPYFAILAAIGALIPDLDREYLFGGRETFKEEQWHRSLFHNLLFFAAIFFISPWLALGAFLHSFLDALTTVKDRGVEWLFPFSRLVKRGRYALGSSYKDGKCALELDDQKPTDRVYFLNEDTAEMTELSDPDLQESKPVPWRRTYGPALNGKIIDNWFFIGSLSLLILYSLINQSFAVQAKDYVLSSSFHPAFSLFAAIVLTYAGGWIKSKDKSWIAYGIPFAAAGVLFVFSAILSLENLSSYKLPLSVSFAAIAAVILLLEAVLIWRFLTRGGRQAVV
jgi:hypothetical protein